MNVARIAALVLLAGGAAASGLSAQETCTVLRRSAATSTRIVVCAGDTLQAVPDVSLRAAMKARTDLDSLRVRYAALDTVRQSLEQERALFQQTLAAKNEYIVTLEQLSKGYEDLASGYRKLSNSGRTLSFEGGIGVTGDDTEPALLVGLGIRKLRIWGFAQESNAGVMLGINLPLF